MPILYPLARSAIFRLPPEVAHNLAIRSMAAVPRPARALLRGANRVRDERLATTLFGIRFENPVGLAAGLDKDGIAFNGFAALGFGHVEIGTITGEGQPGNPKPRMFRIPEDRALLNRMGFNNPGAAAVARELEHTPVETILGINIGKSKVTPLESAVEDYSRSVDLLAQFARYFVINVSSPNTPGLRDLQEAEPLRALVGAVVSRARAGATTVPVLVKLAPDLSDGQLEQAVGIAAEQGASGIVAVNTTLRRDGLTISPERVAELGAGGVSGAPLRQRALEVVRRIHAQVGASLPIIGVGGIFSVDDAWERIRAGASLVQLYSGLIYEGPGIVRRINRGLLGKLEEHGFRSIAEAVGSAGR